MIRRAALQGKVYYTTTINGAEAVCQAFAVKLPMDVYRLQDLTGLIFLPISPVTLSVAGFFHFLTVFSQLKRTEMQRYPMKLRT